MHLDKTAGGTVSVVSLGQSCTAAKIPVASPPLRAGGYSFKADVDQCPLLSSPIEVATGKSLLTCQLRSSLRKPGALSASKAVGLGDFAPHSPLCKLYQLYSRKAQEQLKDRGAPDRDRSISQRRSWMLNNSHALRTKEGSEELQHEPHQHVANSKLVKFFQAKRATTPTANQGYG